MNRTVQAFFAYQFIKNLTKDFRDWEAYRLGLIDRHGNKLRDAKTSKEKEHFAPFYNLIRKSKRLLSKVPGGRTFVGSIVAAGLLLKEEYNDRLDDQFIDLLFHEMDKNNLLDKETLSEEISLCQLEPGVYTNINETKELYNGQHLFYVKEPILAETRYDVPIYKLDSVLHGSMYLLESHITRIR